MTCQNNNRENLLQIGNVDMPGCRIIRHPDDHNCWFCPNCRKKFIEDPGIPKIPLTISAIFLVMMILIISSPENSQPQKNINNYSESSQPVQ